LRQPGDRSPWLWRKPGKSTKPRNVVKVFVSDTFVERRAIMPLTRDEFVARLIRAGELEVSGEDQAETDSYFDTGQFRFQARGEK
jgi:hypothetical protein